VDPTQSLEGERESIEKGFEMFLSRVLDIAPERTTVRLADEKLEAWIQTDDVELHHVRDPSGEIVEERKAEAAQDLTENAIFQRDLMKVMWDVPNARRLLKDQGGTTALEELEVIITEAPHNLVRKKAEEPKVEDWAVAEVKGSRGTPPALMEWGQRPMPVNTASFLAAHSWLFKRASTINLWAAGMTAAGISSLVPALRAAECVVSLTLDENPIGDAGAAVCAQLIPWLPKLEDLLLDETGITDSGVATLVEALPAASELRALSLNDCGITDAGGELLEGVVRDLPHVRSFGLRRTKLQRGGWPECFKT